MKCTEMFDNNKEGESPDDGGIWINLVRKWYMPIVLL